MTVLRLTARGVALVLLVSFLAIACCQPVSGLKRKSRKRHSSEVKDDAAGTLRGRSHGLSARFNLRRRSNRRPAEGTAALEVSTGSAFSANSVPLIGDNHAFDTRPRKDAAMLLPSVPSLKPASPAALPGHPFSLTTPQDSTPSAASALQTPGLPNLASAQHVGPRDEQHDAEQALRPMDEGLLKQHRGPRLGKEMERTLGGAREGQEGKREGDQEGTAGAVRHHYEGDAQFGHRHGAQSQTRGTDADNHLPSADPAVWEHDTGRQEAGQEGSDALSASKPGSGGEFARDRFAFTGTGWEGASPGILEADSQERSLRAPADAANLKSLEAATLPQAGAASVAALDPLPEPSASARADAADLTRPDSSGAVSDPLSVESGEGEGSEAERGHDDAAFKALPFVIQAGGAASPPASRLAMNGTAATFSVSTSTISTSSTSGVHPHQQELVGSSSFHLHVAAPAQGDVALQEDSREAEQRARDLQDPPHPSAREQHSSDFGATALGQAAAYAQREKPHSVDKLDMWHVRPILPVESPERAPESSDTHHVDILVSRHVRPILPAADAPKHGIQIQEERSPPLLGTQEPSTLGAHAAARGPPQSPAAATVLSTSASVPAHSRDAQVPHPDPLTSPPQPTPSATPHSIDALNSDSPNLPQDPRTGPPPSISPLLPSTTPENVQLHSGHLPDHRPTFPSPVPGVSGPASSPTRQPGPADRRDSGSGSRSGPPTIPFDLTFASSPRCIMHEFKSLYMSLFGVYQPVLVDGVTAIPILTVQSDFTMLMLGRGIRCAFVSRAGTLVGTANATSGPHLNGHNVAISFAHHFCPLGKDVDYSDLYAVGLVHRGFICMPVRVPPDTLQVLAHVRSGEPHALWPLRYETAACVGPVLFRNGDGIAFIQWLVYHLEVIKIDHVVLYLVQHHRVPEVAAKVMRYYHSAGRVTLIDWSPLGDAWQDHSWCYMQPAKENDCLNRFRYQAKYLVYIDPDEFLELDQDLGNITAFLRLLEADSEYGKLFAVRWRNKWHSTELDSGLVPGEAPAALTLEGLAHGHVGALVTHMPLVLDAEPDRHIRHKYIVRPDKVYVVDTHQVLLGERGGKSVDAIPDAAHINHYHHLNDGWYNTTANWVTKRDTSWASTYGAAFEAAVVKLAQNLTAGALA